MSFSDLLHWLRMFGVPHSPEHQAEPTLKVVSLLTDASRIKQRYGQPGIIAPTKDGVRFLSGRSAVELKATSRPTHPYQELAVFGDIGLRSTTALATADGRFTLEAAVRDCLANVQIREASRQEPEWKSQVLAYYLPPVCSWQNRWGEWITLEKWTQFLLERDVSRFCCGGTHLLDSLALILQADSQCGVLSANVARRVRGRCQEYRTNDRIDSASQRGLGLRLGEGRRPQKEPSIQILVTGHILDAQMYFPEDVRISSRCAERALTYLAQVFANCNDRQVFEEYCPYSHAGRVLLEYGAGPG